MNVEELKLQASRIVVATANNNPGSKLTLEAEEVRGVALAVLELADLKLQMHPLRVERWWATFNAALAGLLHRDDSYNAVPRAREIANETHGKLEDL